MNIKFSNNAETFLDVAITDTDTALVVADKSTSTFPKIDMDKNQYFMLLIFDAVDSTKWEYLKCIAVTDTSFTVVRAQEGTVAQNFPIKSRIIHPLSAESLDNVQIESRIVRTHAEPDTKYGGATGLLFGHASVTDDFELGTTSLDSIVCSPYALRQAINRLLALPKEQLFTYSTTWTCPESGTYTITCVGGGGTGGTGGYASYSFGDGHEGCTAPDSHAVASGGGGGAGGAGQTITKTIQCTKGTAYSLIVGGPSGTSVFGASLVVAAPGGKGYTGGDGYVKVQPGEGTWSCPHIETYTRAYGGAPGADYGGQSTGGSAGRLDTGGDWPCGNRFVYGGTGGQSVYGSNFGRGGNGGRSGGQADHYRCYLNIVGPTGGTAGIQGCIKIVYPLGVK